MALIPALPDTEMEFLAGILAKDAKNYHVWAYRQWLVEQFSLWPTDGMKGSEVIFVEGLLRDDVRNNSAWNHRFYVLFGKGDRIVSKQVYDQEIQYSKTAIDLAPQNAAAWNYLKGVLRKQGAGAKDLEEFALKYTSLEDESKIRSSHALDFLADIWAKEASNEKAIKALDLLGIKYDPVRANYWNYRKSLLISN